MCTTIHCKNQTFDLIEVRTAATQLILGMYISTITCIVVVEGMQHIFSPVYPRFHKDDELAFCWKIYENNTVSLALVNYGLYIDIS